MKIVPKKTELAGQLRFEREELIEFLLEVFNRDFLEIVCRQDLSERIIQSMTGKDNTPVLILIGLDEIIDKSGSYHIGYFIKNRIISLYSKVLFGLNLNDRFGLLTIDKKRAPQNITEVLRKISFKGNILTRNTVISDVLGRSTIFLDFIDEYRKQGYSVEIIHKEAHTIISIL